MEMEVKILCSERCTFEGKCRAGLIVIECLSVVDWIFRCKGCSQKIEADECNLGFKWPMTEESLDTSSERSVSFH